MSTMLIDQITMRQGRRSPYEILSVAGIDPNGRRWSLPVGDVIHQIWREEHAFVIRVHGAVYDIGVYIGPDGPYLRAFDGTRWTDALLDVPRGSSRQGADVGL